MWDEHITRNPMLLLRLSGLLLSLRMAARVFLDSLFQEPPRSTRWAQARTRLF